MSVLVMQHVAMIDYESATPVYRQVAAVLRGRIEDGTYPAGRRLPSITGLVQEFGIAQLTARKALHALVVEGLAEMTPGMGTYVKGD
jgi:GntR family transcriptional regulator